MTWTIEMTNKELTRKTEVELVISHRTTQKEPSNKLGVTERQFRRILQRYRQEGDSGLVSRKRGKPSNRRTDAEIRDEVYKFITDSKMKGFGPTFMSEKFDQKKGIKRATFRTFQISLDKLKLIKNQFPQMDMGGFGFVDTLDPNRHLVDLVG